MSLEADVFTALRTLVSNRVYPSTFVQPSGALPVWPAIRYDLISQVPDITQCGDSGDEAIDTRIQLDIVDKTFMGARALRQSVMAAMQSFVPPATYEISSNEFDSETKTYRETIDYMIYKST